ncbi:hypothetical protein [Levilactobacillus brevis]|uniref:hypothetical protein n=1 Tax=Levilactobacillus brevis TaxID=1580 RepID=UPI001BDE18E2|nr:hypothetical protein [Levilactobacillus brevis]
MKKVLSYVYGTLCVLVAGIVGGFIGTVAGETFDKIKWTAGIEISATSAMIAFIGMVLVIWQMIVRNQQRRVDKRPHFSILFRGYLVKGDLVISKDNNLDLKNPSRGFISVNRLGELGATDVFSVATYKDGHVDYVYVNEMGRDSKLLDFKDGVDFSLFEMYFKTSINELGKVTFRVNLKQIVAPEYEWGFKLTREYKKVVKKTGIAGNKSKAGFVTYSVKK